MREKRKGNVAIFNIKGKKIGESGVIYCRCGPDG